MENIAYIIIVYNMCYMLTSYRDDIVIKLYKR